VTERARHSGEVDRSTPPGPGPLRPFQFPPIDRFVLGNGLSVLCSRTDSLPVTTFSLLLPAGGLREDPARAGLATLTGSLLESGTEDLSAAQIAEKLESLGTSLHVGTSWEVSHIDFTSLSDHAREAAELAASVVRGASFPDDEVERIRQEQLAGILQRRADPRGLANEMASRFIFSPESPFSRPLSGTPSTVQNLHREDVHAFHSNTFTPRSAALIVAGSLTTAEVREAAEAAFGDWTGTMPPAGQANAQPRADDRQVVIVSRPGAVQAEIRVGHIGPRRSTADYFAVLVMNTILGGSFSSRLNMNLRERNGFTYGASSAFLMRRQSGAFLISTAVQTEVTGAAVREILGEMEGIRSGTVSSGELSDARQYVAGTFPLRLQTTDGVASRLADLFIYDLPDSYLDEFAERVLAVSEEDVREVAQRHLMPDRLALVIVGDADGIRPQLEELGLRDVHVLDPSELP
jgi:zinc protease